MKTEFKTEKTRTIVNGVFENMTGTLKALTALNLRDMKFIWVKVNLVSLYDEAVKRQARRNFTR